MYKEIFFYAQDALKIDLPLEEQKQENVKVGHMGGRKIVAIVLLSSTSVLVGTAAIVSAFFASYLIATLCAVAFLSLAISTLVVSQIKPSQDVLSLIQKLTQKIRLLFDQIQDLKKDKEIIPIPPQPQELELKKRVEDLTKELENKNQELTKPIEPNTEAEQENARLKQELDQVKLQLQQKEAEKVAVPPKNHEEHPNGLRENGSEQENPLLKPIAAENEPKIDPADKTKKELQDEVENLKKELLEKKALVKSKEILLLLQEIFIAEKKFLDNMINLKAFFASKVCKSFMKDEYKQLHADFELLIKESRSLISNLESRSLIRNLQTGNCSRLTFEDKIDFCQKAFSEENFKDYVKAVEILVPKIKSIKNIIIQVEKTEKGNKLIKEFAQNNKDSLPEEFVNSIHLRIPKHILLLQQLERLIPNQQFENRLTYLRNSVSALVA